MRSLVLVCGLSRIAFDRKKIPFNQCYEGFSSNQPTGSVEAEFRVKNIKADER